MHKYAYNSMNRRKSFNDELFWKCYRIERKITSFLTYKVTLMPSWEIARYYLLIVLIVISSVPRVVKGEEGVMSAMQSDLHLINPVIETLARVHEFGESLQVPVLEFNIDEKDRSSSSFVKSATLPIAPNREPQGKRKVVVTFYSSTIDQTDSTPFITARGSEVRDGIIAANFLPFGTKVKLPELFDDKVFIVEDRMHERFTSRIDVWVPTRKEAVDRGVYYTVVEVY